jgi:hypothetical protein
MPGPEVLPFHLASIRQSWVPCDKVHWPASLELGRTSVQQNHMEPWINPLVL